MDQRRFHLIGIGGIGMSALARFLLEEKHFVSGSDLSLGGESQKLMNKGVEVYSSHARENITTSDTTVVYSTAINEDNPELLEAKHLQCKLWHRSDLLSYLISPYQSLAVAGTHGKTTTSAILTHVLLKANMSPSFVIGGLLSNIGINAQRGEGRYFIIEADESDRSLLKYNPFGSIVTNIEADHLDHYKDLEDIKKTFNQFLEQVQNENLLFWYYECENLRELAKKGTSYGFDEKADLVIFDFKQEGWKSSFSVKFENKIFSNIELSLIGKQNVLNAAAVFGLCLRLKMDEKDIREGLVSFPGVRRRLEKIGEQSNINILDDYAHHPTEVAYLMKSLREVYRDRRIIVLFQPHRYSRTKHFINEFSASFEGASEVWVTDIYAAAEKPIEEVSSQKLAEQITNRIAIEARYIPGDKLEETFLLNIKPHDVFITVGAGNITTFAKKALELLGKKKVKLKVGLIYGSTSPEHHVAIISANYFFKKSLNRDLYDLTEFKIEPDGKWSSPSLEKQSHEILSPEILKLILECDILLPIVHGNNGEDGMLQGFLETLNKAYIGPDYMSCALAMNKVWAKEVVQAYGINVGNYVDLYLDDWKMNKSKCLQKIEDQLSYPLVSKPTNLGSTLGISFSNNQEELLQSIERAFSFQEHIMIEEKINGREFEISVLEDFKPIIPNPGEIRSDIKNYDYNAKYSQDPIQKIPQADLPPHLIEICKENARMIFQALDSRGFIRIDFFLNESNEFIFGEVNPIPGCTPLSLFPRMLLANNMTAEEIVTHMIIKGLFHYRKSQKRMKLNQFFLKEIEDVTKYRTSSF